MHPTQKKPLDLYQALDGKRESHTLRLPPEASELLKAHAEAWSVSRADVVAWCVCTALGSQTPPAEPSEDPAQPVSGWADVMGRFEQAVVRFEQAILSSVSASHANPRSPSEQEDPAAPSEAMQPAEAPEQIEAPQHVEAPPQAEALQRAEPSGEPIVALKPTKARNTEASAPKEAIESAPATHPKTPTGFSSWSDAECLDYRVFFGGEVKTVSEWLEPLRARDKSAHATARKNIPRLMRRTKTPPAELVSEVLQRFGLLQRPR
jgi:hypothetical protein